MHMCATDLATIERPQSGHELTGFSTSSNRRCGACLCTLNPLVISQQHTFSQEIALNTAASKLEGMSQSRCAVCWGNSPLPVVGSSDMHPAVIECKDCKVVVHPGMLSLALLSRHIQTGLQLATVHCHKLLIGAADAVRLRRKVRFDEAVMFACICSSSIAGLYLLPQYWRRSETNGRRALGACLMCIAYTRTHVWRPCKARANQKHEKRALPPLA